MAKNTTRETAPESITEFADSRGITLAVDREAGVIRGVKLLGLSSANGRTYLKEAVARAVGLYEGARVNVDHANGAKPDGPRSYGDRIGVIRNVSIEAGDGGLRGDLHANPKHRLFEQLAWDAEHSPQSVGLSHNILGKTRRERGGRIVVEEITRVQSVDLVADPATTRGLYEQSGDQSPNTEDTAVELKDTTLAILEEHRPDLLEQVRAKLIQEHANSEEVKAMAAKLDELTKENDQYRAAAKLQEQRAKIDAALAEAKLPEALVTEVFKQTLLEAKDEVTVKSLIEDRAALAAKAGTSKPRSKEQALSEGETTLPTSSKELAARWVA